MAAARKAVTLDQIKTAADIPGRHWVAVPEWGKDAGVYIRGLKRGEARLIQEIDDDEEGNAKALTLGLVEPAVTEEEAGEMLAEKSLAATNRILGAILEASGIRPGFRPGTAD